MHRIAFQEEETVEMFLLNWLQYQVQPTVCERTYQTYQQTVTQHLLPSLGQITLQKRRQQTAPSTIQKIHRILHHALNDALKLGHVTRNVSQFVELPPEQQQQHTAQALTVEQARKLLATAQDDPLEASSGTHGILAFFYAARMQHERRIVNVRRCEEVSIEQTRRRLVHPFTQDDQISIVPCT